MVSDERRNGAFEAALRAEISAFRAAHGRGPHVLDIGAGSGLLAMLAARHGAANVERLGMDEAYSAAVVLSDQGLN